MSMAKTSSFGRLTIQSLHCTFGTTLTSYQLHEYEPIDPEEGIGERIANQIIANEGKLSNIATKLGVTKKMSEVFLEQLAEDAVCIIVQWPPNSKLNHPSCYLS